MIISFNARENHYKDRVVVDWYKRLYRSEKSRKINDILYAHIIHNQHNMESEVGESPIERRYYFGGEYL